MILRNYRLLFALRYKTRTTTDLQTEWLQDLLPNFLRIKIHLSKHIYSIPSREDILGVLRSTAAKHDAQQLNDRQEARRQVGFADQMFISKADLLTLRGFMQTSFSESQIILARLISLAR